MTPFSSSLARSPMPGAVAINALIHPIGCGQISEVRASSSALPRVASASVGSLQRRGPAPFDLKAIVDENLRVDRDITKRANEHAAPIFFGFSIGAATVVDPARGISTVSAVDHAPIGQAKEKCVSVLCRAALEPALRFLS